MLLSGHVPVSIMDDFCLEQAGVGKALRKKSTQNKTNGNDNIEALIAEAESIKDNADVVLAQFETADEAVLA